jgi:prepilin-type processing-associated H-X9-DG protein
MAARSALACVTSLRLALDEAAEARRRIVGPATRVSQRPATWSLGDYDATIRGIFAEPRFDMAWWDGHVVA